MQVGPGTTNETLEVAASGDASTALPVILEPSTPPFKVRELSASPATVTSAPQDLTVAPSDAITMSANAEFGPLSSRLLDALDRIGQTPHDSVARAATASVASTQSNLSATIAGSLGQSDSTTNSVSIEIAAFTDSSQLLDVGPNNSVASIALVAEKKLSISGSKATEILATDLSASSSSITPMSHPAPHSIESSTPGFQNSKPADTHPPLSAQVSRAVMEHIERQGIRRNDSVTVRLDPPELGEMTIRLSQTHEGLAVRVTAREAITMDMLFARGQEIESHLRGQQLNLKSLEFLKTDMSGNGYSQSQQQNNAPHKSENLMNQVRRGSRGASLEESRNGRASIPESSHGLSFRA